MRSEQSDKESHQVRVRGRISVEQHLGSELESGTRIPCHGASSSSTTAGPVLGLIVGRRTHEVFFLAKARRRDYGEKFRPVLGARPPTLAEMGQVRYGWIIMDVCWALGSWVLAVSFEGPIGAVRRVPGGPTVLSFFNLHGPGRLHSGWGPVWATALFGSGSGGMGLKRSHCGKCRMVSSPFTPTRSGCSPGNPWLPRGRAPPPSPPPLVRVPPDS